MSDGSLRRQVIEVLAETQDQFDAEPVRSGGLLHRRMADALVAKSLVRPAPASGLLVHREDGSVWRLGPNWFLDEGGEERVDTGQPTGAGGPTSTHIEKSGTE